MESRQISKGTTAPRRSRRPSAGSSEDLSRQISEKAFELFQKRGGGHGDDQADWFEAERLVRQSRTRAVSAPVRAAAASRPEVPRPRATASRRKTVRKAGA